MSGFPLVEAIRSENLRIIAQASLVKGGARNIPPELRGKAINHVITENDG